MTKKGKSRNGRDVIWRLRLLPYAPDIVRNCKRFDRCRLSGLHRIWSVDKLVGETVITVSVGQIADHTPYFLSIVGKDASKNAKGLS
ncbi:MAG: hypothetical protein KGI49_02565 [Patescibacteria group bacterium]|nr:hypothetical protein [Patescibacteria group bacterium]